MNKASPRASPPEYSLPGEPLVDGALDAALPAEGFPGAAPDAETGDPEAGDPEAGEPETGALNSLSIS